MSEDTNEKLREVIAMAFPNSLIPENIMELEYGAIEEWDSLGNFALLMLVEQKFGLEFTMNELSELKSIKQILIRIKSN
jgi:acyl carrier protein